MSGTKIFHVFTEDGFQFDGVESTSADEARKMIERIYAEEIEEPVFVSGGWHTIGAFTVREVDLPASA